MFTSDKKKNHFFMMIAVKYNKSKITTLINNTNSIFIIFCIRNYSLLNAYIFKTLIKCNFTCITVICYHIDIY